jgi:hypothetical protein
MKANVSTILEPRLDSEGRDSAWEQSIHQITELVFHWVCATLNMDFYDLQIVTAR